MDQFADEYAAGRTPNPCVLCNIWLKFGKLWAYGKQVGADFVATGHYARIATAADGTPAGRARRSTRSKDQSYVLFGLPPRAPARTSSSRSAAIPRPRSARSPASQGLPVHDKPDSQEICFVPDDDYLGFVRERRPELDTSGPIVDEDGHVARRSTRGSRGSRSASGAGWGSPSGEPRYVVQIEPAHDDRDRRPPRVARQGGPGGLPVQLAGPRAPGADSLPGPDPGPAQAVPAVVEPLAGGRARVVFDLPSRPSPRDRSSPCTRTTWSLAAAGSTGHSRQDLPARMKKETSQEVRISGSSRARLASRWQCGRAFGFACRKCCPGYC